MRIRSISTATAGVAALALALTACGGGDGGADADGGDGGTITIGVKYDQPGLGLEEGGDKPVGLDVDVATYVAKELGYDEDRIEWTEAASANRETFLQQGTVDMIVATYSITDERKELVDFAGPYYVAQQDILVQDGDDSVGSAEDLAGKKLCSASGSRSAHTITDTMEIDAELRETQNYSECLQLLTDGQIDAITTDDTILAGYAAQQPGKFQLVGQDIQEERYGIGLPKGSTERCEAVNEAIAKMYEDGSAEKFLDANFGEANFDYDKEQPEFEGCA
ncbi:glutamate transport system substrate-binding protein [Nocardiopsis mwathae]|uniref:Glutamate transport system substrate-binding protein n=1 Tax=Nocardiopsis mwathae TaxID=1472723 RepID=A0A7W9YEQ3_9ACTN|nr:glutamate ABC transporter substrate-binding protein [Nocardiopsis mwathae]MBB6170799.1 glutamate transport system substrate-binding protein [Nocardiopsis mwathae]